AYGCKQNGEWVGRIGNMGCYSLNDFKHISCGDGGVELTDDEAMARKLRRTVDKGYSREADATDRNPTFLCANYRMTELQGAVGIAQLAKMDSIVERRQKWCNQLLERLAGLPGIVLPEITAGGEASWWFFLFRVDPAVLGATADEFAAALEAEQVP